MVDQLLRGYGSAGEYPLRNDHHGERLTADSPISASHNRQYGRSAPAAQLAHMCRYGRVQGAAPYVPFQRTRRSGRHGAYRVICWHSRRQPLADNGCAMERRDRRPEDRLVGNVNSILSRCRRPRPLGPEKVNPPRGGDDIPPVRCSQGASCGGHCGVWIFSLS